MTTLTALPAGTCRIWFFQHGIAQTVECPEAEAKAEAARLTKTGGFVYRTDYSPEPAARYGPR